MKTINLGIIVVLVIAVIGVGAYVAMQPAPTTTTTTTSTTSSTTTTSTTTTAPVTLKMAQVHQSSVADHGWGTFNYEGLQMVESELGWDVAYSDLVGPSDWVTTIESYADKNYDLISMPGAQFTDPVLEVAPNYPNLHFLVVGGIPGIDYPANVGAYDLGNESAGYLCGVLAAEMSQSNKIGIISAIPYPNVVRITEALKLGAKAVSSGIEISEVWTGDWTDIGKGYEAASTMIDQGVDVIYAFLDEGSAGVTNAIKEKALGSVYYMGSNKDQSYLYPEGTLTSIVQRMDLINFRVAQMVEEGTFEGGYHVWGIDEGIVYLAPLHSAVPAAVSDEIAQLTEDINDGTLVVPRIETPTT